MAENQDQCVEQPLRPSKRGRNGFIFLCIVCMWLVIDQVSKSYFDKLAEGDQAGSFLPGILDFRLVHNTGAAWGAFDNMTFFLAVLSLVICIVVLVYLFFLAPNSSILMTIALAMVFAGGIGNMIDRLTKGYVVDFLEFGFMDFPVFNIADIGVTCGVALFFIAYLLEWRRESAAMKEDDSSQGKGWNT